jgi:hypothetical protein
VGKKTIPFDIIAGYSFGSPAKDLLDDGDCTCDERHEDHDIDEQDDECTQHV